jgi:N-acetylglucosaminyldiphosphoundecaprenol N-acetyl-beta-D-mannosaminyltransferase
MPENLNKTFETVSILDIPFARCSFDDILGIMEETIANKKHGGYISITNTESVYQATRKFSHYQYIQNATFSCCDGIGIVLIGKMLDLKIPRLHGPDLMIKCCEYGRDKEWRHFFYGGRKGVPELLKEKLTKNCPDLIVSGGCSPPFRKLSPEEDQDVIDLINEARPDILWVGLGLVKQEKWIAEHLGKIKVPWMIGVGAAFDFHAGRVKRAPLFFRRMGLEWLYRLAFEPRMLIRNYYSLAIFFPVLRKIWKTKISKKTYRKITNQP